MKQLLTIYGYLYIIGGNVAILLVNIGRLPHGSFYVIIFAGLLLYTLKLYCINNCTLGELNGRALVFDMLYYLYQVFLLIGMGLGLYGLTKTYLPEPHFSVVFPKPDSFFVLARQGVFIGSLMIISDAITSGVNHPIKAFDFTNKVAVLEVLRILIVLLGVGVFPEYVFVFISFIAFNTMPDHVKVWLSGWLSWWYKRPIDLTAPLPIENNSPEDYLRAGQLMMYIRDVFITPIIASIRYQVGPLCVFMLVFVIVFELATHSVGL